MTIKQFDVVPYPIASGRKEKPYLVCIQHRRLDHVRTRLFATLIANTKIEDTRLNPEFKIEDKIVYLDPTDIVTLSVARLGDTVVNLEPQRDRIIAALDLVFTGV